MTLNNVSTDKGDGDFPLLGYLTLSGRAREHLAVVEATSTKVEARFDDVMRTNPDNTSELYEALWRSLDGIGAKDMPLKHGLEEMVLDQIHRWILREELRAPLACGRLWAKPVRHQYYFPRVGRVCVHSPDREYPETRFSFADPRGITLIPEHIDAWEGISDTLPPRQGGLPRGRLSTNDTFMPSLRSDDDQVWGFLMDLESACVDELIRPEDRYLYRDFYELEKWRVGICAEWIRLARKWCPRLGDGWLDLYTNRYPPGSLATVAGPDRLVMMALVLLTRLATVNQVTNTLERSPDYVFLTGLFTVAYLHSRTGIDWVYGHAVGDRAVAMLSIVEFYQDHLRPRFTTLDLDILLSARPALREATIDWEMYTEKHLLGGALYDLLGDLKPEDVK